MIVIRYILLFLILFSISVSAAVENYNSASSLELEVKIGSTINAGSSTGINFIKADLHYLPIDTLRQTVLETNLDFSPKASTNQEKDYATFTWVNSNEKSFSYSFTSKVKTNNVFSEIKDKISFPIKKIPADMFKYTKSTEFIDITSEIEAKAQEILGPIDLDEDIYEVVFKIADWTKNNIEYNLNTLTAEVDQKSSWVLQNKQGVCDEITNLFISFLRSIGIPARFVSGVIYTNINYQFSSHGWAEVYFPDYGWVPFDVTLGQYGWLSPDHLRLKDDVDSGTPAVFYSWSADNDNIEINKVKIETKVNSVGSPIESPVDVQIYSLKDKAGFGSYVPLAVTVTNKKDFYVSTQIAVTKAPGLLEKNVREILLKPKEMKTIYWTLVLPLGLRADYSYLSDLEISDNFGNTAFSKISYDAFSKVMTKQEAVAQIDNLAGRETKKKFTCTVSDNNEVPCLKFDCSLDKSFYYKDETANIKCNLKAQEDLDRFKFCILDNCGLYSLKKDENKQVTFQNLAQESGRLLISAETEDSIEYSNLPIKVVKIPKIFFSDITPESIDYNKIQKIGFIVNTNTEIYNVDLDFNVGHLYFDKLSSKGEVLLKVPGFEIIRGIPIKINYKDEEGKKYSYEDKVFIKINKIPWYINLLASLHLI